MSTAFNISKGRIDWYFEQARTVTNRGILAFLLKASGLEADSTLADHDNTSLLLGGTTDEADFTNYVRKTLAGTSVETGVPLRTIDDTNNRVLLDLPDLTWTTAGGTTNNALGAILLSYDPDTTVSGDSTLIPLLKLDVTTTTDGTDLIIRFNADGVARVL